MRGSGSNFCQLREITVWILNGSRFFLVAIAIFPNISKYYVDSNRILVRNRRILLRRHLRIPFSYLIQREKWVYLDYSKRWICLDLVKFIKTVFSGRLRKQDLYFNFPNKLSYDCKWEKQTDPTCSALFSFYFIFFFLCTILIGYLVTMTRLISSRVHLMNCTYSSSFWGFKAKVSSC